VSGFERWRQRHPASGPLFAVAAFAVLLVDPRALFDLGAWLSVAAIWGATAASNWAHGLGVRSEAAAMVASSIGSTVATAPVAGYALGLVSLVGVVLNLVAIPLAAFAVPGVVASLLIEPVLAPVAGALAAGSGTVLALIEWLAVWGARADWLVLQFEAGIGPAAVAAGICGIVAWAFGTRQTWQEAARRLAWTIGLIALVAVWPTGLQRGHAGHRLTLHFLDVGQGDAALAETPEGHWILIDAGPANDRSDAGERVIVPYLRRHGVKRLEAVILSHGHRDHFGGLRSVVSAVDVGVVLDPGVPVPDEGYIALLDTLAARHVPWRSARRGDRFQVDGVEVVVLHPDPQAPDWGLDLNESSLVVELVDGPFSALFVGDAGAVAEPTLPAVGQVDVLKVGHHGSSGASSAEWLGRVAPRVAVVSVGMNRYGHPSPAALHRLMAAGAVVWRTDESGTVDVDIDHDTMTVQGKDRAAQYPIVEEGKDIP
jgi:competence protein ComEC